jgi:chaperone required for assembly of F1-ATPase
VFDVLLDGKPIKTPRRKTLSVPTHALAEALAAEWRAQSGEIKPLLMPLNRLANTAIDRGAHDREHIITEVLRYASTDLLCYRAEEAELAERQRAAWDPILDWLSERHRARLEATTGMAHIAPASEEALLALDRAVRTSDPFALTALHAAVTATGSIALGLALLDGRLDAAEAFALSQLDETYQAEKWGEDKAAMERARTLARDLEHALRFHALSRA